ncbi:MAG: hypothetical protein WAP74_04725 [Patescibacteria group bacterium]
MEQENKPSQEDINFESSPQTPKELKPHFPTSREIASQLPDELKFGPGLEKGDAHVFEYHKAGRNLDIFSHQLSAQEKRPVLIINNARVGALFQVGEKHWLENFASEERAQQFVDELHQGEEYQKNWELLQKQIEDLKNFLNSDLKNFAESLFGAPDETNKRIQELIEDIDPSSDIRLETASNFDSDDYISLKKFIGSFHIHFGETPINVKKSEVSWPQWSAAFDQNLKKTENYKAEKTVEISDLAARLNQALIDIAQAKDYLRSLIFKKASEWLDQGKIKSFVYPINHFKLSGSGSRDLEIDKYGQAKLYKTVSLPESLVVFADPHFSYSKEKPTGGNIGWKIESKKTKPSEHDSPLRRYLNSANILQENLEYPLSENADFSLTLPHKRLLAKTRADKIKIMDLQVLFPTQKNNRDRADYESKWGDYYIGHTSEDSFYDPDVIMDPDHSMGGDRKKILDELNKPPDWIKNFKDKIPLEPNYTYGGKMY